MVCPPLFVFEDADGAPLAPQPTVYRSRSHCSTPTPEAVPIQRKRESNQGLFGSENSHEKSFADGFRERRPGPAPSEGPTDRCQRPGSKLLSVRGLLETVRPRPRSLTILPFVVAQRRARPNLELLFRMKANSTADGGGDAGPDEPPNGGSEKKCRHSMLQIKTMLVHPSSSTSFPSAEGGLHASARSFSSTSSPTSSIGGHHRGYGWHARTSGGLHRCSTSSATAASTPPNVAIDSKIEQAMDLVKTHLMFAVREEVEVLRARIIDLESHLQSLQAENNVLRSCVPDDVLKKLEKL